MNKVVYTIGFICFASQGTALEVVVRGLYMCICCQSYEQ